ncbi:MAG: sugar transferase, partial [bacterium]
MIPIILFAYNRPDHLRRTLDCLRENRVPLIYAFSDGPCTPDKAAAVAQVRDMLRAIDWCDVVLCERELNLGLGRSILAGVTEVL